MWIANGIEDNFVEKSSMWITFSRFSKKLSTKVEKLTRGCA